MWKTHLAKYYAGLKTLILLVTYHPVPAILSVYLSQICGPGIFYGMAPIEPDANEAILPQL